MLQKVISIHGIHFVIIFKDISKISVTSCLYYLNMCFELLIAQIKKTGFNVTERLMAAIYECLK